MAYKDPQKAKENAKKKYQRNRTKRLEYQKAYNEAHKDELILYRKMNRKGYAQSLQGTFSRYQNRSKLKDGVCVLTLDTFNLYFYGKQCTYCSSISYGIDRVDSSKGYVWGNMVPCCGQCNLMKLDYTFEEFVDQIGRIHAHLSGSKS